MANLQFASGTMASLTSGFSAPAAMFPGNTSTTAATGFFRMELYGEDWALHTTPTPRPLAVFGDKMAESPMRLEVGMMAEELRCFLRVARGVAPVPTGARFEDGLQIQRWIESLDTAATVRTT